MKGDLVQDIVSRGSVLFYFYVFEVQISFLYHVKMKFELENEEYCFRSILFNF